MTKKQILEEIGLDDSYHIHECYENDKIIFVQADKEKEHNEIVNCTFGQYAKWKDKGEWFRPDFYTDDDVYKEIHNLDDISDSLK